MPASAALRHKEKNRFKFKTFSEHLAAVNIDAIHRVKRVRPSEESPDSSKFLECLLKWKDLDLSADFVSFRKEIFPKCQTFKLVVHYLNDIFDILEKHLSVKDTLALQALLEHLVALCIDVGPDFYPKFFTFFPILTSLLKTKDTQKLEWVFTTISMLFRNLWRYMIFEMDKVLQMYVDLLTNDHPPHIASFAAESISFLLRKTRNSKPVFEELFKVLQKYPKSYNAIGQVLFYVMKTSQHQFHSSTDVIFPVVLSFLSHSHSSLPEISKIFDAILTAVNLLAEHTRKEFAMPVWKVLIEKANQSIVDEPDMHYAIFLIKLLNKWCSVRQGSRLVSETQFMELFTSCLNVAKKTCNAEYKDELFSELCKLASTVLNASKSSLELESKIELVNNILQSHIDFAVEYEFLERILLLNNFESLYFQPFLQFCHQSIQFAKHEDSVLKLIAKFALLNNTLPHNYDEITTFKPQTVQFSFIPKTPCEKKLENVAKCIIERHDNWQSIWYSLVVFQCIKPVAHEIQSSFKDLLNHLLQKQDLCDESIAVLAMACQTLVVLHHEEVFIQLNWNSVVSLLKQRPHNCNLLFVFDILLSKHKNYFLEDLKPDIEDLTYFLEKNMSSYESSVRRLTLKILQKLDVDNKQTYLTCLLAENTPATVSEFRGRILHLGKLKVYDNSSSLSTIAKHVAIRCLFSQLYVNFSSLWQPVQEIISSFAVDNKADDFWKILFELLDTSMTICKSNSRCFFQSTPQNNDVNDLDMFDFAANGNFKVCCEISNDKPDHLNYRLLLWKTVALLPQPSIVETSNRLLVNMLFQYLSYEYFIVDKQLAPAEDVKFEEIQCGKNLKKSTAATTLLAMFSVFERFTNPSFVVQSERLYQLYCDFLSHPSPALQKSAFNCVLTFNNKALKKYKEQLLLFLDEKKFRDAVTHFVVDELLLEDRSAIMPVLLRILLGKMKSKSGASSGGKALPVNRRSIIVRFLRGINESEMKTFINMIVDPYTRYMDLSCPVEEFLASVQSATLTVQKIMPIARQQGIIKTIQLVISKNKQQLPPESYSIILRVLIGINAIHSAIISDLGSVSNHIANSNLTPALRSVKKQASECLLDLLKVWPDKKILASAEIELLFEVQVWPELPKLAHESAGKPGSLLKLLMIFAERLMYLPFLIKENKFCGQDCFTLKSPLHAVVDLLNSSKVSSDVVTCILNVFISMVSHGQDALDDSSNFFQQFDQALSASGKLTMDIKPDETMFGLTVLLPYLSEILSYFIRKMRSSKKGFIFPADQLQLLLALSEHVKYDNLMSSLSELLLNHVMAATSSRKHVPDSSYTLCLKTLSNVLRESKYIVKLAKLFSKISDRQSRLVLVSILKQACESQEDLLWMSDIVYRLNAWDKRFVEELDFDSRLTAFQDVIATLKSDDYDVLFGKEGLVFLPIMHCCIHTMLTYYSDISLRESVFMTLGLVIDRVNDFMLNNIDCGLHIYQKFIRELLLPTVETALCSPDEGCRHEGIKILSKLVSVFPNETVLVGLNVLRNETSPDEDCFENICHIQMHRRARAFRKIAKILNPKQTRGLTDDKKMDDVSVEKEPELDLGENVSISMEVDEQINLTNIEETSPISHVTAGKFILPLVIQCLHTQNFKNLSHLHDALLDVVRSCASLMQWPGYKKVLLQNIHNLKNNNTSIEVICAMLEVFPFNLHDYAFKSTTKIDKDFISKESSADKSSGMDPFSSKVPSALEAALQADVGTQCIATDLSTNILPKLNNFLTSKDEVNEHNLASAQKDIENCKRKIPLAIAIVSVLRKMPSSVMRSHLSSVILKVFAFLKHKLHDVRIIAGDTTVKILKLLGPTYLLYILKQLKSCLSRGFQRHVLIHVVNSMLSSLVHTVTVGCFEESLPTLQDILNEGLFGETAAEKQVDKLRMKIPEARGRNKALPAYHTIARFINISSVASFLEPLKRKLDETHDHNIIKVLKDVFNEICLGLLANSALDPKDVLTLVYGLVTENVAAIFVENGAKDISKSVANERRPQSCLLIEDTPKRYGTQPTLKANKTNLHVLVEFALKLLHLTFKRHNINLSDQSHLEMLDPLVPHLSNCLKSTHLQTVIYAIRCLTKLFRTELPSLSENAESITAYLFKILRDHTKGTGNQETAAVSFKSLSVLCFSSYGKSLTETQLKVLLAYAEEDLYDEQRQSQSFNLIKSILKRDLHCNELIEVVDKVRKIAIQSHSVASRSLARSLYLYFLINYPLPVAKLDNHIEFMLAQLNYEYEDGRMSALELLSSVVTTFPDEILSTRAGILFVPTSALLINDESSNCRKAAAEVIKFLLKRLPQEATDELISYLLQWYTQDRVVLHQRLGAMLICIFAEVEGLNLRRHLVKFLPQLNENLTSSTTNSESEECVKANDHTLFHHLSAFLSILRNCDVFQLPKLQPELFSCFSTVESLLHHPHDWIQLISSQIFGYLFSTWEANQLTPDCHAVKVLCVPENFEPNFLRLAELFCDQLKSMSIKESLAEQAIKNLLFLARVFDNNYFKSDSVSDLDSAATNIHKGITYILTQLQSVNKHEQSHNQKVTTRRVSVLKFCAALTINLGNPERFLVSVLDPVYRSLNINIKPGDSEVQSIVELRALATEVMEVIKNKVGNEVFTQEYRNVTRVIVGQKQLRKKAKALQLVSDPIKAAAFKIRKHEKQKEQRKRRIAEKRPEYGLALAKRKKKTNQ